MLFYVEYPVLITSSLRYLSLSDTSVNFTLTLGILYVYCMLFCVEYLSSFDNFIVTLSDTSVKDGFSRLFKQGQSKFWSYEPRRQTTSLAWWVGGVPAPRTSENLRG